MRVISNNVWRSKAQVFFLMFPGPFPEMLKGVWQWDMAQQGPGLGSGHSWGLQTPKLKFSCWKAVRMHRLCWGSSGTASPSVLRAELHFQAEPQFTAQPHSENHSVWSLQWVIPGTRCGRLWKEAWSWCSSVLRKVISCSVPLLPKTQF